MALSSERLTPYVSLATGDKKLAICLYLWNAQLSESLQIAVHVFEVTLRNAIHRELSNVYGDCWYDNPRFPVRPIQQDMIQQVKYNLLAQGQVYYTIAHCLRTNYGVLDISFSQTI